MELDDYHKFLDPQTLAKLDGLEMRARLIVEGYVAGAHRSPSQGFSIEFAEHREYVPGDDIRHVDWKVFGKTDKYYLKQYEEETNLISYLLLDASESMAYKSAAAALSKFEYAQCVAASLAYLVLGQQDSVGLVTFDDDVQSSIRPGSGRSHLKQLLHAMSQASPQRKTNTGSIFHDLAERLKRRGIVIVLTDAFDHLERMLNGLKHLKHRRHDVILFHVLDPSEIDFPFNRTTTFKGLEGLPDIVVEPNKLRKAYHVGIKRFLHSLELGCRERQVDYVQLRTDRSLALALSAYLSTRLAHTR